MAVGTVGTLDAPNGATASLAQPEQLCPGQFVLGPWSPEQLLGWKRQLVARDFWLTTHPGLPATTVSDGVHTLTLIGFVLDPSDPAADDRSVLSRLLETCSSIRRFVAGTATLGGRWLVIAACDDGLYLVTDALGLRRALYTQSAETQSLWVMSQPGLAIDILGLAVDEQAAEFLDSYVVRARRPEYYWPGMSTPLRGLRHLLPNHTLNLRTGRANRYWPDGPLPALSVTEAVERIVTLMPGLLRAAANRFELALSITAGVDSRLVLAAARPIKDQICYVTVRQAKMADNSEDLSIPARLLAGLGLEHEIIRAAASMSADFSWAFKRGVSLAHDHYGPDAEAILARFDRRKVAVTGSGAEVGRCAFRTKLPFSDLRQITAEHLAWLEGMYHPYAIQCFQEWLADIGDRANVKLLDLFEWEQGQGNWLAMTQLEFDVAWRDILTPYNCRTLLTTMLSVDERYRRSPDYTLFMQATGKLWREVLGEPVNPGKRSSRLRRGVNFLRQSWCSYARVN